MSMSMSMSMSMYPSIHLSIHGSIYPSIHLSIHPCIHLIEQASEVEHSRSKMQYRRVRAVTDRQKTDGLRSSNDKLAKCAQTLSLSLGLSLGLRALTLSLRLTLTLTLILTLALALALALTPTLAPTLARCVQTLHAKGLGRLATAITNKSGSLGRGVKGMSIYGKFKGEHEDSD